MSLATKAMENRESRIWAASYDAGRDAFRVAMEDGRILLLKRPIPEDDGSEIMDLFLEGDGEVFTVIQASGNEFSVPWDAAANLTAERRPPADADVAKRIGSRVKALRQQRRLTQAQLAALAGLQRPNIARLEAGVHVPSILLLERLAQALGVPLSELIAA